MKHAVTTQPVITEKSMQLAAKGWYTFKTNSHLDKPVIATAIASQYGVHVTKIKTLVVKGKTRATGKKRLITQTSDWKKAMVRLKANEKIAAFTVEQAPVTK